MLAEPNNPPDGRIRSDAPDSMNTSGSQSGTPSPGIPVWSWTMVRSSLLKRSTRANSMISIIPSRVRPRPVGSPSVGKLGPACVVRIDQHFAQSPRIEADRFGGGAVEQGGDHRDGDA